MKKYSAILTATAFVLTMGVPSLATARQAGQSQSAQAKPAPAPAPAAAATVAGKWVMAIQGPQGAIDAALEVKLDKMKVTGTLDGPQGPVAIEGEYTEGTLGFLITIDMGGTPFSIHFSATMKEDGTLAGTADMGEMGQMAWTAKRVK